MHYYAYMREKLLWPGWEIAESICFRKKNFFGLAKIIPNPSDY